MATNAVNPFDTPTPAGYSPPFLSRQNSQFLNQPGPQGQVEGAGGGQQQGMNAQGALWAGGAMPANPPSSVPSSATWGTAGGGGEGQSSLAQSQPQQAPQWTPEVTTAAQDLAAALMSSSTAGYRPQQPTARQAWGNLMRGY